MNTGRSRESSKYTSVGRRQSCRPVCPFLDSTRQHDEVRGKTIMNFYSVMVECRAERLARAIESQEIDRGEVVSPANVLIEAVRALVAAGWTRIEAQSVAQTIERVGYRRWLARRSSCTR